MTEFGEASRELMNGRERVLALLEGRPVDSLPTMPITMMFAADQIGAKYFDYATDFHVQAEGQVCVAKRYDIDHVSVISNPGCEGGPTRSSCQQLSVI
jgi:uroporphyrinogen-III decarboxylase